jgi:chromosome segregation ATPase
MAAAEQRAVQMEALLAERDARVVALDTALGQERAKATELSETVSATDAAGAEIAALEAALRERGHVVARLQRDLAEAERVGKELVSELSAGGWMGDAADGATSGADLRARLDTLALAAARSEADLQAATWRVHQLERELGDARTATTEPGVVQRELEHALAAARDEVAALRQKLASAASS